MDLRNTYYALRHAESLSNTAGIITSRPPAALLPEHGLSPRGKAQAAAVCLCVTFSYKNLTRRSSWQQLCSRI